MTLSCAEVGPDPRLLSGPLLVDADLDAEQRQSVQAAIELWADATQGRFAPELQFGPVECGDPFAIEAVAQHGCSIGKRVKAPDGATGHVLGATDPDEHWVAIAAWLEGTGFRDTVAHELGHYLMLGHGEGIMAQVRHQRSAEVADSSIDEFCAIWGC